MGQIRKARGTSRRKHRVPLSRHMKVIVTYMLLIAIIFSNMSNPLMNVFAGQKREEFRIHADELQRAAEEALEEGNAVEEPLDIYTKDSSLQKEYDELFAADGTLYEIFPDYERENDLDGMDLRVFLRLSPEADPKSYVLTGEETFIFLYINGGDETAAGRINIDGYISGICSLKSYDAVFNKDKVDKGNGGGHHSNIVIDSKTEADPQPGSTKPEETESAAEEKPTEAEKEATANADNSGEKNSQSEDKTEDNNNKSDKSDAVNEDKSQNKNTGSESDNSGKENDSDSGNASDTGNTSDTENKEDNSDASDQDPSENEGGSDSENNNDASDTDTSDSEQEDSSDHSDDSNSDSSDTGSNDSSEQEDSDSSADTVASISIHPRFLLAEVLTEDESLPETDEQETKSEPETEESQKETTEAPEETEAETSAPESEKETLPQETKTAETRAEESLPQETKEETQPAKESEADSTTETGAAAPEETTPTDDTKLSDVPDAVNKVEEESEPSFDRVGALKGETYNLASLDQTVTIRAFTAKLADMGYDKDELESQGHIIDYMIDPTGSAELVKAPKLVRDGAEVVFGVIPQTGYKLMEVTANGVELEEVEAEDIASPSNATRAAEAVYYVIPEVLEDQEVEIFLEEEIPGSHPAFEQSKTINGVTVTITAEEGILPEGTQLEVTEVTDQVEEAVKAKTAENTDNEDVVTAVIAYDINLMLDGKKLNNDWGQNHHVNVKFSGNRIEELSKEADTIQVETLETPTETVEAALGGTEEMPVIDNITSSDIQIDAEGRESIDVSGETSVNTVEFEANHFTIYTIRFSNNSNSGVRIIQLDENGDVISKGTGSISVTNTSATDIESLLNSYTPSGYTYSSAMLGGKYGNEDTISYETLNAMTKLNTLRRQGDRNNYSLAYTGQDRNLASVSGIIVANSQDIYVIYHSSEKDDTGINLYYLSPANDGYRLPKMNGVKFTVDCLNTAGRKVAIPDGAVIPDQITLDSNEEKVTSSMFSEISIPGYTFTDGGYCFFWWSGNEDDFFSTSAKATVTGFKNWSRVSDNYPGYNYIGYNSNEYVYTDWKNEPGDYVAYNPTGTLHVVFVEVSKANPPKTYYESMKQEVGVHKDDESKAQWSAENNSWMFYPVDKQPEYTESYLENHQFAPAADAGYKWEFKGWTQQADSTGNGIGDVITDDFFKTLVNKDVYLHAKWEKVQVTTDIEFTKVLEGISGSSDKLRQVQFAIYNADDNWRPSGSVLQTVTASDSGAVRFTQLPVGKYLIYETQTADGYILLTEPIKVTIAQDEDNTLYWSVDGASEKNQYTVVNRKGVILPDTGGQGLDSIHRIGWSVILTSIAYAGFKLSQTIKRKREE